MKTIKHGLIWLVVAALLAGCAGVSPYTYQSAGIGGAVGAGAGALIDKNNRWRGAMIGALGGAALGGAVSEITRRGVEHDRQRSYGYYQSPGYNQQAQGDFYFPGLDWADWD